MDIGSRIAAIRKQKGVSQAELAKRSNISQAGISYIEKGLRSPSADTLELIANALNISVSQLLSDKTSENATPRPITDAELKFALFDGDQNITDAQFEEVKRFAQFIRERDRRDK